MVIEKRVKVHHHIHYFYIDENKILIFLFLMICFRLYFNVLKQNREFAHSLLTIGAQFDTLLESIAKSYYEAY